MTLPNERDALEQQIHASCDAGDHQRAATLLLEGFGREIFGFAQTIPGGEGQAAQDGRRARLGADQGG